MRPTYLSSAMFGTNSLSEIADACRAHGVPGLELGISVKTMTGELLQWAASRPPGLPLLIHNYFPRPETDFVLNLASGEQQVQAASRELCANAVALSAKLSAPFYAVHSGFAVDPSPNDLGAVIKPGPDALPFDECMSNLVASLKRLCAAAQAKGVRILLENHVLIRDNLVGSKNALLPGTTAEELLEIIRRVDSPALGLLIDTGHLKVSARTLGFSMKEFLDRTAPHVGAFHLSDNDGLTDSNSAFGADAWFLQPLEKFSETPVILEVGGASIEEGLRMLTLANHIPSRQQ